MEDSRKVIEVMSTLTAPLSFEKIDEVLSVSEVVEGREGSVPASPADLSTLAGALGWKEVSSIENRSMGLLLTGFLEVSPNFTRKTYAHFSPASPEVSGRA